MEIPPKKPHFFKPILPGFKNGLKIPIGFLKYLKGHDHIEHVVLKRAGNKWLVKMNGRRLEDGWEKFAEEHDLRLGDMLIFRHEGDMDFDVSIFDSTHCDTEYAEYMQIQKEKEKEVEDENENEDDEVVEDENDDEDYDNDDDDGEEEDENENDDVEEERGDDECEEAATHDRPFGRSHFEFTIRQYCLSRGFMWIPQHFAFANGLINRNKKFGLIILDERQTRLWNLTLHSCKTQAYIADGWRKFSVDNCLKEGDRIMFEIIAKGGTQIWKFQAVSNAKKTMRKFQEKPKPKIKTSGKAFSNVEATMDMHLSRSQFICTIKPYSLSKYFLCIPKRFAQENRLIDRKCNIIMSDKQRSWTFSVYTSGEITYFGRGWHEFCITNCLKEGDHLMFEMISNGETPIFRFHDLRGSSSLQAEVKMKKLDTERMSDKGLRLKISSTPTPESQVAASEHAYSRITSGCFNIC
ncbi:B3 domain-containing protein REM14-like [Capsicum chacoense]